LDGQSTAVVPVAAWRSAEGLRPAALCRLRPGERLQPALPVRLRAVLHHLQCHRPAGACQRVPDRHGGRCLHPEPPWWRTGPRRGVGWPATDPRRKETTPAPVSRIS